MMMMMMMEFLLYRYTGIFYRWTRQDRLCTVLPAIATFSSTFPAYIPLRKQQDLLDEKENKIASVFL